MSRNVLLAFVAICWAGVAVDAIVHLMMGDLLVPAGMTAAFAVWAVLWRMHYAPTPAEAKVPVEG
jgi:hypothetical protein